MREILLRTVSLYLVPVVGGAKAGAVTLGWASAFAVVYFLAAQLGLLLLCKPSGVAAFWPAAGIAAGILIVLGRRACPAVVIGVVAGTVAANLISDRSLSTSILKGICNAAEVGLMAWLVERWFGRAFAFSDLSRVTGFFAAAGIAAAVSATGGAGTLTWLHTSAPFWAVWRAWFLSDGIGILMVAPIVIELSRLWREPPSRGEMIEGVTVLALLALLAIYVHTHPTESWIAFDPDAFTLPPLLWLAARCPSPFAIAGAFVVSIAAICTTIFGIGHLSDAGLPIIQRVHGVQATVALTTVFTLVLTALFTDRRSREVLLERSNQELRNHEAAFRRLLGALPAAIHTTDTDGRITFYNKAAVDLWGATPEVGKDKCSDLCRLYGVDGTLLPIDECPTKLCLAESRAIEGREAILERPDGVRIPIIPYPAPLIDEQGAVVGVVSIKLDITERKRAEAALAERNAQFALASKVALVGSHTYDCLTEVTTLSPGSAAIYGLPEGRTELSRHESRARVHPGDLNRLEAEFNQALEQKRRELVSEFRIVRADNGQVRWIEARSIISYDVGLQPLRVTGVSIDVTERRQSEDHKAMLIAELDHRVKNVLACVSVIAEQSRTGSNSIEEFLQVLRGRIRSLANTHDLLSRGRWQGVALAQLVLNELAPCMRDGNTLIEGPAVDLRADSVQAIAIVLHELATNAAKYGALSNHCGQVSVRWNWQSNGSAHKGLVLEWRETDGPPVSRQVLSGYGTSVIRDLIPYELGGTVDYVLASDGVRCKLEIPAEWLSRVDNVVSSSNEQLRVSPRSIHHH
jgi:PAS domain S-box-containing protein